MTNIFVGNLSYGTTEESVRSLFESYGTVERVSIVTDRETGQPRGFGFVEMTNADEAQKAIAGLNGKEARRERPERQRSPAEGGPGQLGLPRWRRRFRRPQAALVE